MQLQILCKRENEFTEDYGFNELFAFQQSLVAQGLTIQSDTMIHIVDFSGGPKVAARRRLNPTENSCPPKKMSFQGQNMNTVVTPIWRLVPRTLCTFLLGIAVLWAMPKSVEAQPFDGIPGDGIVGEYNATTGAAIKANFITELFFPSALAVSGNNLLVADVGRVGEYSATTGAAINANFVQG